MHSLTSTVHVEPVQPAGQLHVKLLTPSVHEPPLAHGLGLQSLMLVVHVDPDQPAAQLHE